MVDARDISSLHADLSPPGQPGSKIHIDVEGFVYADRDGKIHLSSNFAQHTGDELGLKTGLKSALGVEGRFPVSFFVHTDLNSISDPDRGYWDVSANRFLEGVNPRGVLGLEASTNPGRWQAFARGSLGMDLMKPLDKPELAITGGLRIRFGAADPHLTQPPRPELARDHRHVPFFRNEAVPGSLLDRTRLAIS